MAFIPKQLGPYHLHEEVNAANGVLVYYATDTRTQQDCLLYLLDSLSETDPARIRQFLAGVEAASQLRHKHILALQEQGQLEHYYYAASEPLAAITLTHALRQRPGRLPDSEVTTIVQQVAAALDYAAAHGLLHLALSPHELWLKQEGQVQVSGFGLAGSAGSHLDLGLTDALFSDEIGLVELSPFVAPEQLCGDRPVDQRADVYSLCAIAYTLMVGRSPFQIQEPAALYEQIIRQLPVPPDLIRPDLPAPLAAVLKFGLAKDPNARYTTATEFAYRLCQAQQGAHAIERRTGATRPAHPYHLLFPARSVRSWRGLLYASLAAQLPVVVGWRLVLAEQPRRQEVPLPVA